jgi:Icc protein
VTMLMNRRRFLALTGAAGLSSWMGPSLHSLSPAGNTAGSQDFTFLFITDTHLQPELNAAQGCDQCFNKGVHFIVLDSIGITSDRSYEGRVDAVQLDWLKSELAGLPGATPIIVSIHIPLVTAFSSYVPVPAAEPKHHGLSVINAYEVIALFEGHNVLGVLQGHTHINERVVWKGVPYITSGAVCGNWWHGSRMGTPEGFTVVHVEQGKLSTTYESYGFRSVDPQNT